MHQGVRRKVGNIFPVFKWYSIFIVAIKLNVWECGIFIYILTHFNIFIYLYIITSMLAI